jgi:hypothetical protein
MNKLDKYGNFSLNESKKGDDIQEIDNIIQSLDLVDGVEKIYKTGGKLGYKVTVRFSRSHMRSRKNSKVSIFTGVSNEFGFNVENINVLRNIFDVVEMLTSLGYESRITTLAPNCIDVVFTVKF